MTSVRRRIYQLKVTLDGVEPPVWRRLLVPGGYTLDRVHRAIQYAMGWRDCHLHCFDIGGSQYGVPDPEGELELLDEMDVRLDAVADGGNAFRYTYDYGDWWEHTVEVEDEFAADPDERYPICVDGRRACPPEDAGGSHAYTELLAVLEDPKHPEYERVRDWVGRGYDPESFAPGPVTTLLRRLV